VPHKKLELVTLDFISICKSLVKAIKYPLFLPTNSTLNPGMGMTFHYFGVLIDEELRTFESVET